MVYIGVAIILSNFIYCMSVTFMFFGKRKIKSMETQIYGLMIITNIFSLLFELGSIFFVKDYTNYLTQSFIINKAFILSILVWTSLLTVYVYIVSFPKIEDAAPKKNNIILVAFFTFFLIMTFLVMFLPLNFYSENDVVYSFGPSADMVSVIVAVYVVTWIICSIKRFKNLGYKKYIPMFVCITSVVVTLIVRTVNPGLLLINATISLVTVLMYNTIENPDLKMVEELNVLNREAESANIAKKAFLQQMSHEIATPMTHAIGLNDLNKNPTSLKEVKENAKIIEEKLNLINDIALHAVTMSGIISGDIKLESLAYKTEDLLNIVDKIIAKCPKNVKFIKKIDKELPKILDGDNKKVINIFEQLLSNAFKFTLEGTITLEVSSKIENNKCKLTIKVIDTGIGIRKEDMRVLFNAFEKPHWKDDQAIARGAGMGLSITKKLAELMNGDISVKSKYGQGSEFTVKIEQEIIGKVIK